MILISENSPNGKGKISPKQSPRQRSKRSTKED